MTMLYSFVFLTNAFTVLLRASQFYYCVLRKMSVPRINGGNQLRRNLSQSFPDERPDGTTSLSQPCPRTSVSSFCQMFQNSSTDRSVSEEETHVVNKTIRLLFILDKQKEVITKARITKNAMGDKGKHFLPLMNRTRTLLSEIFGYRLVELGSNKYILVNEIRNEIPHIRPFASEGSRQVLLFIVLTHIFMHGESCTEESLWDFLTHLNIFHSDYQRHAYFSDIKHLITKVFVAQKYLDKTILQNEDSTKLEFKWGPRAEYEFSRRAALDFVSQVYNGRPINRWPLQFKALIARERSNKLA